MGLNLQPWTDAWGNTHANPYADLGTPNVNWIGNTGNLPMRIFASKADKAAGRPPLATPVLSLQPAPLVSDAPPTPPASSMDDSKSSAYLYLACDMAARPADPQFAPFLGSTSS